MKILKQNRFHYLYLVLVFLFFGFMTEYSHTLMRKEYIEQNENDAREVGLKISTYLDKQISQNLALTQGLAGYIYASNGNTNPKVIDSILEFIYEKGNHIRNLGFAPGNRISYVYPREGNEKVLGIRYEDLKDQWPDVKRAIDSKSAFISGPIDLIQGGKGFIYRIPIYLENGKYYGIANIVMNIDKLLNPNILKGFMDKDHNLVIQSKGEILFGSYRDGNPPTRTTISVYIPTSYLEIVLEPSEIQKESKYKLLGLRLAGWSFNLVTFILILSLIRENSIRKRIEKQLIYSKEVAESASQSKSQFLTNMSHEIRTPLNAVMGFTQILQDKNLDEETNQYLKKIQDSSNYLLRILSGILDFSRAEAGIIQINYEDTDLYSVLNETKVILEYNSKKKNLVFSFQVDEIIQGKQFLTDEVRLKQILLNIIGNAIKYTDQGKVEFRCKVQSVSEDKVYSINFQVSDTGVGIEECDKEKVFQYFQRGSEAKNKKYSGTGLGLAISKNLIEQMGGEISFDSRENEGTTFYFHIPFPLAKGNDHSSETDHLHKNPGQELTNNNSVTLQKTNPKYSAEASSPDSSYHILLVEDNELNQMVSKKLLENMNQKVQIAGNGKEAIELLELDPSIQLVFMDISMPVMDGVEATKYLRSKDQFKNLPIVALSAHVGSENIKEYISAGMNYHIPKPVNKQELARVLKDFLEN